MEDFYMTNLTELVFILDRSGSMSGLEKDTIGGYNAMLEKQKAIEGEALVTTVLFDHRYELLHDRIDLRAVAPITEEEYTIGGSTALLDAIGRSINKITNAHKHTASPYRADKILFVITTDGMENSSREYDYKKIKKMVETQKSKGWEFIFLGANIDAVDVGERFGIDSNRAKNYHGDSEGTSLNFKVTANAISSFRETGVLHDGWGDEIEEDYHCRGGKKKGE
jgi:uncharacterized protein YegL